jgi:hypothetical protein
MTLTKGNDDAGREVWIDEWNQTEIKMMFTLRPESVRDGKGYFACAYDNASLYLLWDFVSCNTKLNTQRNKAYVCVGTSHHNRTTPDNSYDFMFSAEWYGKGPYEGRLVGFVWTYQPGAWHSGSPISSGENGIFFASDLGKSPHSSEQHLIFEAKIPLSLSVKMAASTVGILAGMSELNLAKEFIVVHYPNDSSVQVPNQWADLRLMAIPIPEFSNMASLLAESIALIPILFRRPGNHRRLKYNRGG